MCDDKSVWNSVSKNDKHKVSFPNMCLWLFDLQIGLVWFYLLLKIYQNFPSWLVKTSSVSY